MSRGNKAVSPGEVVANNGVADATVTGPGGTVEVDPARPPCDASKVIAAELEAIQKRRAHVYEFKKSEKSTTDKEGVESGPNDADSLLTAARKRSLEEHTLGVAFSGGGIRSGTYAVGFLQGISRLGLLRRIDYLSTVSGGGYAGAWLAAWLKREGDPENVEKQLSVSRVKQAEADRAFLRLRKSANPAPDSNGAATGPSSPAHKEGSRASQVVDEEPEPVFHLRQYSSYLFPRFGVLTADTWTVIAIWSRNIAINLMMLFPLAMMVVLAARIIVWLYGFVSPRYIAGDHSGELIPSRYYDDLPVALLLLGLGLLFRAFNWNAGVLGEFRQRPEPSRGPRPRKGWFSRFRGPASRDAVAAGNSADEGPRDWQGQPWIRAANLTGGAHWFQRMTVVAVVFLTVSVRAGLWRLGSATEGIAGGQRPLFTDLSNWLTRRGGGPVAYALRGVLDYIVTHLGLLSLPSFVIQAAGFGAIISIGARIANRGNHTWNLKDPVTGKTYGSRYVSSAFVAGATGGVLLVLLEALIRSLNDGGRAELAATIVPPLGLLIIVAAIVVEVALLGRMITEAEREWWARIAALLLIAAISWLGAMATILYVPALYLYAGAWARLALTSGWLAATAASVVAGRSAGPTPTGADGGRGVRVLAAFGPPTFLVGLLGLVSLLVAYLVNTPPMVIPASGEEGLGVANYFRGVNETTIWILISWFVFMYLLFDLGQRSVDVNLFSLHAMYANRLARCYLGASRPKSRWIGRWGGPHDPTAGGGAPSLSPCLVPSEGASGAEGKEKLREKIRKLGEEADAITRKVEETRVQPANSPASLENQRVDWIAKNRELRDATTALVRLLNVELESLGPDSPKRAEVEHERDKCRTALAGYEIGQQARDENPLTGFDPRDDIPLFDLQIGGVPAYGRTYWGPQLLLNAELNLISGGELAWRDRKGESFVMTPQFCGSKSLGYASVGVKSSENLTLGRAMTISGAAIDPNMSYMQTSALTAFLTIFNARLGYWMQSPRTVQWDAHGPNFGDRLLGELLGRTDEKGEFVHLSDGGHFENLGLYELIRRRCRYIVAVDAGEDANASNDNLGILVRLARIDFGIRVELDTRPLEAQGPDKLSRTHVVIGRVHYEDVDSGQVPGILVYIKISMTGDEPSDLQRYAKADPRFPHQPTDFRQSFDEEQFECYRALGEHIAMDVFADAVNQVDGKDDYSWGCPRSRDEYVRGNQKFMSALRGRWASPPTDHDARFVESARSWSQVQRDVRMDAKLRELSRDLYPELLAFGPAPLAPDGKTAESTPPDPAAEMHAVGQMLQVMEDAWILLDLKGRRDLPTDRGWINTFRRWANTRAFQRFWPTLRSEFSPDFVKFCEGQLRLVVARGPTTVNLTADYELEKFLRSSIRRLTEEFRREWPDEAWPEDGANGHPVPGRGLDAILARALTLTLKRKDGTEFVPAWLVVQAPSGGASARESADRFACGVIAVCPPEGVPPPDPTKKGEPLKFELFAWIRRPNRSTGLGSRCIDEVRDLISDGLKETYPDAGSIELLTRFPRPSNPIVPDLEQEMWKGFFALYDFQPRPDLPADPKSETLMVRTVKKDETSTDATANLGGPADDLEMALESPGLA